MITSNGLFVVNQYLTNSIQSWAGSIALGALSSTATASGTTALQYEFFRAPVVFKSYRTVSGSNQIVLKANVDPTLIFNAYEIGVFPMTVAVNNFTDHFPLTDFSEQLSGSSAWYISGSPATTSTSSSTPVPRVGQYSVQLPSGSTLYNGGTFSAATDFYTSNDSINILYYISSSIGSSSITVSLGDDTVGTPNVWTASTTLSATASGSFYSASLQFGTKPTSFTDNVTSVSVQFLGSGTIFLDHMKIVTGDTKTTDFKLVSRTSSASPIITKTYGQPMDIEYILQVT